MAKTKGSPKTGGRAKGTPNRIGKDIRSLAQSYTEEAIKTLAAIMRDKSAPQQARAMAADRLLDRGWGRPPQAIVGDPANPLCPSTKIEMVVVDPMPTIDRPPEETREQWLARRARELGLGDPIQTASGRAN